MSIETSVAVATIAFVALVITLIICFVMVIQHMRKLSKAATEASQELVAVTSQLKPLIEDTHHAVETINDSMASSAAIVKSSKHITQSIALTLQAIQHATHNIAQRAEEKLKDEAVQNQAEQSLQWAELVMHAVKLIQRSRKE